MHSGLNSQLNLICLLMKIHCQVLLSFVILQSYSLLYHQTVKMVSIQTRTVYSTFQNVMSQFVLYF